MASFEKIENNSASPIHRRPVPQTHSGVPPSNDSSAPIYERDTPPFNNQDQAKDCAAVPTRDQRNGYQPFLQNEQSTTNDEKDKWMPALMSAFVFNIFLWVSLTYAITCIDTDFWDSRRYLGAMLSIFLIPSFFISGLIYGVALTSDFRYRAAGVRERLKNITLSRDYLPTTYMFQAWSCLILVILYFFVGALPKYKQLQWENGVVDSVNTTIPSIALVDAELVSSVNQTPLQANCSITRKRDEPKYDCSDAISFPQDQQFGQRYWLFDAKKLPESQATLPNPLEGLSISIAINYPINGSTATFEPTEASMNLVVFDPRSLMKKACNNVDWLPLYSIAVYTINYTTTQITDLYQFRYDKCKSQNDHLYRNTSAPFLSYTSSFGSSAVVRNATQDCLISDDASEFICDFSLVVQSGSSTAQTQVRKPGITKLEIALNSGAVVGGAQFFWWFFTTLIPTKRTG